MWFSLQMEPYLRHVNHEENQLPWRIIPKSLFLQNYFPSKPNRTTACVDNSATLSTALNVCHTATGNRWANFLAVDYYLVRDSGKVIDGWSCRNLNDSMFDLSCRRKFVWPTLSFVLWYLVQRSTSRGVFAAVDTLNGQLQCGCEDIRSCEVSPSFSSKHMLLLFML